MYSVFECLGSHHSLVQTCARGSCNTEKGHSAQRGLPAWGGEERRRRKRAIAIRSRYGERPRKRERPTALPGVEISPPALVVRQICTIFVFQTVSRPREQCIVLYEYTYVSCRVNGGPPDALSSSDFKEKNTCRPRRACG